MAGPFLTQVWKGLLPPLGLSHIHLQGEKQGSTGESLTLAPPCLVSQQSDLLTHPASRASHTQVNNLPTLQEET